MSATRIQPEETKVPRPFNHKVELDLNGAALTPHTVADIERTLTPIAQTVGHVDLVLRRVSIQHLNEARQKRQAELAKLYPERDDTHDHVLDANGQKHLLEEERQRRMLMGVNATGSDTHVFDPSRAD